MDIKQLLESEIENGFRTLNGLEAGTEAHKAKVDELAKFIDRTIEIEKLESENETKIKQADEEKKDRLIRNCMTAAGIIIPSAITIWGTVQTFKFEETGTITTTMGRGFISKLIPKK